ncbi:MAG TPA: C25 family cysteine peptidase, partial [Bacteroidia bacterium]|nr:C25 family cysteine peptidase [Bacteroidia bacterium]
TFSSYQVNGVPSNITAVSYIYCQYPHTTNLGNASSFIMYVPANKSGSKTYFSLSNINNTGSSDTVRIYDLTSNRRYVVTQRSAAYKILLGYTGKNMQCYITPESNINKVTNLIPAGNNGIFTSYSVSASSPAYIIIAHPSLMSEASAYSAYRSLKYPNQVLASVDELYDQFCYGVDKDPLAIRNFCTYIMSKSSAKYPPAALFLIGKGIHSNLFRKDPSLYSATLIPSFGCPSSDALLTAGLNTANTSQPLQPAIPTGRLAAIDNTQVSNYLNKVKTYESNAPALWMKNIAHFAGGGSSQEQAQLLGFLQGDAAIAEDTSFGAYVYTFQKTTTSPIQVTLSDSVTSIINNGVSLMTFFGHASGNNFDINLDAPSNYNNIGKYPLILALACFSGDIFQPAGAGVTSVSEQFVLDPKGSIGFMAMDDVAESGNLSNYASMFYTDFSSTMYRQPIGNCMQNVAGSIAGSGISNTNDFMCLEMTLHGDPTIILNANDSLPDYAVNDTSVSFIPTNVTAQLDSFKVKVVVYNLAKAMNQTVDVELDRLLPGNDSTRVYHKSIKNIYNNGSAIFTLPVDKVNGIG